MTEYKLTSTEVAAALTAYVMQRESIQVKARVEIDLDNNGAILTVHDAPVLRLMPSREWGGR